MGIGAGAEQLCGFLRDGSGVVSAKMRTMAMVTAQPLDVILRDGTTLRLRSPGPDDADALLAFFIGLSQESLYRRFHGFPESAHDWSSRW